ncbi:MAG: hypothetical protein J0L75_09710 [Spirochaetes bacterium]|nr:hypothetical protein [Spirochaetota bacterium]
MDRDANRQFISKTESLVRPKDVTAISFLGDFNRLLPVGAQGKVMKRGSIDIPYMGFIVDPYCFFLAYRITDRAAAQAMLPSGYELADARVFEGQPAGPLVIVGAFSVRTSAFIGNRVEFYIIARKRDTGMVSWIIADYETNTNNYEPKNGFGGYTADPAVLTTTPYGEVLVDFAGIRSGKALRFTASLEKAAWRDLDRELWVVGNLSVDYGGELSVASSKPFSLIFDPALMGRAQEIPLECVALAKNDYLPGLIDADHPLCAAVFPYSQHFIIKQDLAENSLRTEADLEGQILAFLGRTGFKTMTGDAIKKPLLRGLLLSAALTYGLIAYLIIRLNQS